MTKGSTPTLKFNFPFETKYIKEVTITIIDYKSPTMYTIHKHLTDCQVAEKSISVTLTPEETSKFVEHNKLKIQLKAEMVDGGIHYSDVFYKAVKEIIDEVI